MQRSASGPVVPSGPVRVEITGLSEAGEGVGRIGGMATFVPGAVPGDVVDVNVMSVERGRLFRAQLSEWVEPSPDRQTPPCAVADQCGGCQLQHLNYAAQLRTKTQRVRDAIARIGGLDPAIVRETIPADQPWHYRNKGQFPVGYGPDGKLVGGLYRARSHEIIDMDQCLIQHDYNQQILAVGKELLREFGVSTVRHIIARTAVGTGQSMAVLVTRQRALSNATQLASAWMERVPSLRGVLQNVNSAKSSVIMGDKTRVLAGEDSIEEQLGGLRFRISARSFFQVNTHQAERLVRVARELADIGRDDHVIDAYCGIGTFSLFFALMAGHVHGIEIISEAVRDAKTNAAINGIDNATFTVGRVEVVGPALVARGERADVVVVDPPRKGCEPQVLEAFAAMRPRRIVYVSCNPATLARDLKLMVGHGFTVQTVQPVDLFPHTTHVECVALITPHSNFTA